MKEKAWGIRAEYVAEQINSLILQLDLRRFTV